MKLTKTENQSDVILVLAMEKDVSHDFHMMFPNEMPINEPSKHESTYEKDKSKTKC